MAKDYSTKELQEANSLAERDMRGEIKLSPKELARVRGIIGNTKKKKKKKTPDEEFEQEFEE